MKKFFYVFALVLTLAGCHMFFASPIAVHAETIIELNNENFATITESGNYILQEDIVLTNTYSPINFEGNLNGNGYKITLNNNCLFTSLSNAKITNLGILTAGTLSLDKRGSQITDSNFGLLAKSAYSSNINSVFVEGKLNYQISASASVGGLIGTAEYGTNIVNCYSKVEIVLTQYSSEASSTVIGGLVGSLTSVSIKNSFAIPMNLTLINATIDNSISQSAKTDLVVGGLVGLATKGSVSNVINNFCGGIINYSYDGEDKTIFVGKIIGEAVDYSSTNLSNNQTFNEQTTLNFIGKISGLSYSPTEFYQIAENTLKQISTFEITHKENDKTIWHQYDYEWDFNTIWCKKSPNSFIVLQPFEMFAVSVNDYNNSEGIEVEIQIPDVENEGEFIVAETTEFKFGTSVRVAMNITENFLHYKNVDYLSKVGQTTPLEISISENKKTAFYDFVVSGETAGTFYGNTKNVKYNFIVKTQDASMGQVKVGINLLVNEFSLQIEYGKEYSFTANPLSSSYAFSKWVWAGNGTLESQAIRGDVSADLNASRAITVNFGKTGTNSLLTYLNVENDSIPRIEDEITGETTFILQAYFTENISSLEIKTNLSVECCTLKVGGIEINNIVDFTSLFNENIQVDTPIEITIKMKEGFTFNKWESGDGRAMSKYISNTETDTSTTIHLKISEDFVLYLNVTEDNQTQTDLTWLWYTLGGIGGASLIVLVILLLVAKKKRETFVDYY